MTYPSLKKIFFVLPAVPVAAYFFAWLCRLAEAEIPGFATHADSAGFRRVLVFLFVIDVVDAAGRAPRAAPDWWMNPAREAASWLAVPASVVVARLVLPLVTCGVFDPSWAMPLGPLLAYVFYNHYAPAATWDPVRFLRGAKRLGEAEVAKALDALERAAAAAAEPPLRWAGAALPPRSGEGNFCVVGAPGGGKSLMIYDLMESVVARVRPGSDVRAVVYDMKGDALSRLYRMDVPPEAVLVLNPFDVRSAAWDVAGDVVTRQQADHLALSLVPDRPNDREPFFANAARDLLREVLAIFVAKAPGCWTLRHLIHATASPSRLEALLSLTDNGRELIDQYSLGAQAFGNFVQHLGTALRPLSTVAALWEHAAKRVSLAEWQRGAEGVLVLDGRHEHRASLVAANRLVFNFLSAQVTSGPESPRRARFWVFLDELQDASRLDGLLPLLNAGRSKGVRCVLGFQDVEGLHLAYGQHEGEKLAGLTRNVSILTLTSPGTADWAARRIGEYEAYELTRSWGVTTTISEHVQRRHAVMASEFLHLDDTATADAGGGAGIPVRGFHLLVGVPGVMARTTEHTPYPPHPALDYQARPKEQQALAPWSAADADLFGLPHVIPAAPRSGHRTRSHDTEATAPVSPRPASTAAANADATPQRKTPGVRAEDLSSLADFTLPD